MESVAIENKKNGFEKLEVWQEAHKLTLEIYKVTDKFPKSERFSLTDQIRRVAVSISNNIAEKKGRITDKELLNFLYIARGLLEEIKYLLILAKDLDYLNKEKYNFLAKKSSSVGRLLNGFINAVEI